MDGLAVFGFLMLGGFIGLLVGMFAGSERAPEAKAYSAIILAVGSAGISFIPLFASNSSREMWFYPVGLFVGFIFAPVWELFTTWFYNRAWVVKIFKTYDRNYSP